MDSEQQNALASSMALHSLRNDTPYRSPNQGFDSNMFYLTNPDNEIYKMELLFRGKALNEKNEEVQIGEPLMNEVGVARIVGIVQAGIVNQVTIMGNLNAKSEVPSIMMALADTLITDLMVNRHRYGIKDKSARTSILFTALVKSFIAMKRSTEEGMSDKKFWRGSQHEIVSRVQGEQKKSGFNMGSLMQGKY